MGRTLLDSGGRKSLKKLTAADAESTEIYREEEDGHEY
jgi:hypothetical protein